MLYPMYKKLLFFISILWMATVTAQSIIWERNPLEVRERINQTIMAIEGEKAPVHSITNLEINGPTPIRIYRPNENTHLPTILMIHGGAWVGGNLDTHDNLARYLCSKTGAIVISVGYLNSPEGKFPLPLEQCYEALQWTVQNINPSSLAVVGDSAGGNLAAALCLLARDRGGFKIDIQVLINPATDLTYGQERQNDPFDVVRWQAKQYVSDSSDLTKAYVSPLAAKDLRDLPPALVILAEYDLLREMGQKYADRLSAAGVPVTLYCQQGIDHLAGQGARVSPQAKESLDAAVSWLKKALQTQATAI